MDAVSLHIVFQIAKYVAIVKGKSIVFWELSGDE